MSDTFSWLGYSWVNVWLHLTGKFRKGTTSANGNGFVGDTILALSYVGVFIQLIVALVLLKLVL